MAEDFSADGMLDMYLYENGSCLTAGSDNP